MLPSGLDHPIQIDITVQLICYQGDEHIMLDVYLETVNLFLLYMFI